MHVARLYVALALLDVVVEVVASAVLVVGLFEVVLLRVVILTKRRPVVLLQ